MNYDHWMQIGTEYIDKEQWADAENAFREAIAANPDSFAAWRFLSHVLDDQLRFIEAESAIRHSLAIDEDHAPSWNTLAVILDHQGNTGEALNALRQATRLDPTHTRAWTNLGMKSGDEGLSQESEEALKKAIDLDPYSPLILREFVRTLKSQGKYQESEDTCRQAIDLNPEATWPWIELAILTGSQGKHAETESAYRSVINIDPDHPMAWSGLSIALAFQEKYLESENAFKKAIALDSESSNTWRNYGNLLLDQEKYSDAETAFRRSLDLDSRSAQSWNDLGVTQWATHQGSEAEGSYREAINLDPEYGRARRNLIKLLFDQNRNRDAEQESNRYIEYAPEDHIAWCDLGLSQWRLEKYDESAKSYLKAVSIDSSNPETWFHLGSVRLLQAEYKKSEYATRKALALNPAPDLAHMLWHNRAKALTHQDKNPKQVLSCHIKMARSIEDSRQHEREWQSRLEVTAFPISSLQEASASCLSNDHQMKDQAFLFAVQSKARGFEELLDHDQTQIRNLLTEDEIEQLQTLRIEIESLEKERQGLGNSRISNQLFEDRPIERRGPLNVPEQEDSKRQGKGELEFKYAQFIQRVVAKRPELEPFVKGPIAKRFRFSLKRLKNRLKPGEAVVEFLFAQNSELLVFLITREGLTFTAKYGLDEPLNGENSLTLRQFREEVERCLHTGQTHRFQTLNVSLTTELLSRWGQILFEPFISKLQNIHRLWISPHSFLMQLPFNAIPLPDGISRQVAVIPSSSALLTPSRRHRVAEPRFNLGIIAANTGRVPLDLQQEEVRKLRGTVSRSAHRWELTGDRNGEEPTLTNIGRRSGRTKCLVISCHGDGPNEEWGSLSLGTEDKPETVTGRQLVDNLLLSNRLSHMEVDLIATSACLTGQVNPDRPEEWLGLPMALQTVWKAKTMILTLWEVAELPAMIWTVELVKALTDGSTVSEAHLHAQKTLRSTTREQIEALWLNHAKNNLTSEQWDRVSTWWQSTAESETYLPFSAPAHWAPFVLIGNPTVTISRPRRSPVQQ